MSKNLLLFLQRLGNGLKTIYTLPQETGTQKTGLASIFKFFFQINFVLFLDCDMEICIQRCLGRGRNGDTLEILKARFVGHYRDSLPIVEHYQKLGLVRKVDTNRNVSDIFEDIKTLFSAKLT